MIQQFDDDLACRLRERGAIQEWLHHDGFMAVTLTPWGAAMMGVKIAEYWVRHVVRTEEYRGLNRRPARIRIQRWDTASYWTYRDRPDRSIRIPGNTCELPLIGDPVDKSYDNNKEEYLEDWQTWSFTKNPCKALSITIRVGSFAHKIVIQRGKKNKKHEPIKKRT